MRTELFVLVAVFAVIYGVIIAGSVSGASCSDLSSKAWAIYRFDTDTVQQEDALGNASRFMTVNQKDTTVFWNSTNAADNGSFAFTHNQAAWIKTNQTFRDSTPFCAFAWVYQDDPGQVDAYVMGSFDLGCGNLWYVNTQGGAGAPEFRYWDGDDADDTGSLGWQSDTWVQIGVCYDGASERVYYNGSVVLTDAGDSPAGYDLELVIGSIACAGANEWEGHIDQLMLFDQNLTESEIASLYPFCDPSVAAAPPAPAVGNVTVSLVSPPSDDTDVNPVNATAFVWTVNSTQPLDYCVLSGNFTGSWAEYAVMNNTHDNLVSYWTFDQDAMDNYGNNNGTLDGAVLTSEGVINSGYTFDGLDDDVALMTDAFAEADFVSGFSYCGWMNVTELPASGWLITIEEKVNIDIAYNDVRFRMTDADGGNVHYSNALTKDVWTHFCTTWDNTTNEMHIYVNGALDDSGSQTSNMPTIDSVNKASYLGSYNGASEAFNGTLDELMIFNKSLTVAEVGNIYTNSRYYIEVPKYVNITTMFNFTAPEGSFKWGVSCNATNSYAGANDTFMVDWTRPTASVGNTNFFQAAHKTIGAAAGQAAILNLSFTDNVDLYAYEIWVYNGSPVVLLNWTNISISGTSYSFVKGASEINGSLAAGDYQVNLTVWDSHTAQSIGDFEVSKTVDTLDYEGLKIQAVGAKRASTTKMLDRYDFEFTYDLPGVKQFIVESETGLTYVQSAGYAAHFVDWNLKRWVDFEGVGAVMEVKKLDSKRYRVTIGGVPTVAKFSSVGGLNFRTSSYTFSRSGLPSAAWVVPSGEFGTIGADNTSALNVSVTGSYLENVTFHLYNETYSFVRDYVQVNAGNGTLYYYDVAANLTDRAYYVNATAETSGGDKVVLPLAWLSRVYVDNCSISTNQTLHLWLYDENLPLLFLEGDIEILGTVTSGAASYEVLEIWEQVSNATLCLTPATAEPQLQAYVKYTSDNGFTHRYYFINETLNNVTTNISMYNYNYTAGVANLEVTARQKANYNYYTNIYATLQRLYPSEGVWRSVQMDRSGDFGTIVFHVTEQSTDYRMVFQDSGRNILSITEQLKFVCDSGTCELTVLLTPFSGGDTSQNLTIAYSYDNDTSIISVSWTDPTLRTSSLRALVERQTLAGRTTICDTTQSGAAGSLTCNVSGYTGTASLSLYSTASGTENAFRTYWIDLTQEPLGGALGLVDGAFWTMAILVTVAGMGVASPATGVIAMVAGLIGVYALGIFNALTLTFVIIAAVVGLVIGIKVRN